MEFKIFSVAESGVGEELFPKCWTDIQSQRTEEAEVTAFQIPDVIIDSEGDQR
jgi:hypothetical protein